MIKTGVCIGEGYGSIHCGSRSVSTVMHSLFETNSALFTFKVSFNGFFFCHCLLTYIIRKFEVFIHGFREIIDIKCPTDV